jgi:hypothetical protein
MTTCVEWQTMLDEANAALHQLNLGKSVQSFTHGENQQSYNTASRPALEAYARRLQMKVDACNGTSSAHRIVRTIPTDC